MKGYKQMSESCQMQAFFVLKGIDWRWWKQLTGWPSFPITATWPLLPLPLPSKWHTVVLPPIDVAAEYPASAARDAEAVSSLSERVQSTLMDAWSELRRRRGGKIFAGKVD